MNRESRKQIVSIKRQEARNKKQVASFKKLIASRIKEASGK